MAKKQDTGKVNIHGKEYKTVALRVDEFNEWKNADKGRARFGIITTPVDCDEIVVRFRAEVVESVLDCDQMPRQIVHATGHSEEFRRQGRINATSAYENAETSAIGRALAAFGFGGTEFASANEVQSAIQQGGEKASPAQVKTVQTVLKKGYVTSEHLQKAFGTDNPADLLAVQADRVIAGARKVAEAQKAEADDE